ncbi:zf-TFIIB domain-containing protein [Erythrobacter sp. QSSC1-22B]|uniref:TFIIB-type zinc ribbon-containing protein n=1 Tax=Erythrobacter sp. QSSC1-22B TaxID=1860125 RepID=UPI0008302811|nr:zf-TFIIB domain-containing protein [Erythrobacter sp. QSSC1-22B]
MSDKVIAMSCPVDGTALVMSERSGIEIDYCPACRGVWLDRGELDKIIERNTQSVAPQQPAPAPMHDPRSYGQDQGRGYGNTGYRQPKRKKSFLEELFD